VKAYYDARAPEYDDWVYGRGIFAARDRPDWQEERGRLEHTLTELPAARTLDVACGTGWLTQYLAGEIVGLDASESMLEIARERVPHGEFVVGDALALPFADRSFDRLLTGHFYGHLEEADRVRFLTEARRLARELVVVDSRLHSEVEPVQWQDRELSDGSHWQVYKRYFTGPQLAAELGGGEIFFEGRWFVAVCSPA
jgi:ubiquinone/menaquinone biosynthesis C-methylase UbiE